MNDNWPYVTSGIADEEFIRGDVPMTKAEVRAVTLSQLRLCHDSTVYDIGAGTGAITVEAALAARRGTVYAVERDPGALALIEKNLEHFGLKNVEVIDGTAPAALCDLPHPDRVFVGGSGGELAPILGTAVERLLPGGRLVLNCVTLETLCGAFSTLEDLGLEPEVRSLSVTRTKRVGDYRMFDGLNPVFVISADLFE